VRIKVPYDTSGVKPVIEREPRRSKTGGDQEPRIDIAQELAGDHHRQHGPDTARREN